MKTLFLSLICTFICFSLFAQVDSTNTNNNTNNTNVTPPPAMTNNNMNSNTDSMNMNSNNNMNMDSSHNMNSNNNNMSSMNNMRTDSLNINNSGLSNPNNIPGEAGYASLPVLETYVPDNIIADIKQRHPNTVIYDITAVKAPVDSSKMMNQGMAMKDSSMNQNTTSANSNNNNTTTMNSNSNMNSTNNSMANNNMNSTTMAQDSTMAQPQEYNYIVRFDQSGQLTSETLNNDGTALVAKKPDWNNQ